MINGERILIEVGKGSTIGDCKRFSGREYVLLESKYWRDGRGKDEDSSKSHRIKLIYVNTKV